MLYIYFYISVHLHLFISVFLCPYVNEVGGPNLSQQHDWSNRRARQKQMIPVPSLAPCNLANQLQLA